MRIVVDLAVCQGYGQCASLVPDVFWLNGAESLMYDPNPEGDPRARVERAVAACPVRAISTDSAVEAAAG